MMQVYVDGRPLGEPRSALSASREAERAQYMQPAAFVEVVPVRRVRMVQGA